LVIAWNPCDLKKMALPPCHFAFVFNCEECCDTIMLNCHVIMRSNDEFLGHPFNVASYAVLTHMIAYICGYKAKTLAITMTDAHLYANQVSQANLQITRIPIGFPRIEFAEEIKKLKDIGKLTIDDFGVKSIVVKNYYPEDTIKADMVV
jgi:thymidylate synthase